MYLQYLNVKAKVGFLTIDHEHTPCDDIFCIRSTSMLSGTLSTFGRQRRGL